MNEPFFRISGIGQRDSQSVVTPQNLAIGNGQKNIISCKFGKSEFQKVRGL